MYTGTDLGVTWSEITLSAVSPTTIHEEFVYNNRLFVAGNSVTSHFAWDPSTGGSESVNSSVGVLTGGTLAAGGACFATLNGVLYRTGFSTTGNGTTQNLSFWRYNNGSQWVELAQFVKPGGNNTNTSFDTIKAALFTDIDGNMYCLTDWVTAGTVKTGVICNQISINASTGAATITDVTSTAVPSAIQWTNNPGGTNGRMRVVKDTETNPGGSSNLIYYATDITSTTWTQYLWNNWWNVTLLSATNFNVGDTVTSGSSTGVIMTLSGSVIGIKPTNGIAFTTSGSITDNTTSTSTTFSAGAYTLSTMTQQDTGLDCTILPPHSADEAGGDRVMTSGGDYWVYETARTRATTGIQFSIKVHGVTGSETVSLFPYFCNAYTTAPNQQMTISNVTGGSATLNVNNHQIDNVTADGTTIYTFNWLTGTDSQPVGRHVRVQIRAT